MFRSKTIGVANGRAAVSRGLLLSERSAELDGAPTISDLNPNTVPMTTVVTTCLDEIVETFDLLDEWDERYEYIIELGRKVPPIPAKYQTRENEVQGCISTVWLVANISQNGEPHVELVADSDALIVKGLVAILLAAFSGGTPRAILDFDVEALFTQLGLKQHLSSSRRNGLYSMVKRIRGIAAEHAA